MSWRDEIAGILAPPLTPPVVEDARRPKRRRLREEAAAPAEPETIVTLRRIVADKTAEKIGNVLVDTFSAQAALQVYDSLNPENQRKMGGLPIRKMMGIVLKMLARQTG